MPRATGLKATVQGQVEQQRERLTELALAIHRQPELSLQEAQAARWLADCLEEMGFAVERGLCDLPTAFRATYGSGAPRIAFLAEYDALPGIGHACGHNIIAAAALGAGVAARLAVDAAGGAVVVLGAPGEEGKGGKVLLARCGVFSGLDAAMMVHPGQSNRTEVRSQACVELSAEFFGKAAHAAASPEQGINALEAMILSYNAIDALRQHIPGHARIHGIITDGGAAPNVVPDHSAARFLVRAGDSVSLEQLKGRVVDCFRAGAVATGARVECRWDDVEFEAMRSNRTLADAFGRNLAALGRTLAAGPAPAFGSTDMGNVSQLVPSIHPILAMAGADAGWHSPAFTRAACSAEGMSALLDGAKAMAMTAVDLLTDPALLARVKEEFLQGL